MSKWSDIYKQQMSEFGTLDEFIRHKIDYKKKLIETIEKYADGGKNILEVGCGSGVTTIFLSQCGYHAEGIDCDSDMVRLATEIADKNSSSARFKIDNIQTLDSVHAPIDIIFSNGVMEHFSDQEITSMVDRHLTASKYVIISVPSDYFSDKDRMYGDERFMSVAQWRLILSKSKGSIIEEFNFNSDKPLTNTPQFIGFVLTTHII